MAKIPRFPSFLTIPSYRDGRRGTKLKEGGGGGGGGDNLNRY